MSSECESTYHANLSLPGVHLSNHHYLTIDKRDADSALNSMIQATLSRYITYTSRCIEVGKVKKNQITLILL